MSEHVFLVRMDELTRVPTPTHGRSFTTAGYVWMMTNVCANVAHLIVLRKLKLNRDLSNMQVY